MQDYDGEVDLTQDELTLFSLSGQRVKISSDNYDNELVGVIDKFWEDNYSPDKLSCQINVDGRCIIHGFSRPIKIEIKDENYKVLANEIEYNICLIR